MFVMYNPVPLEERPFFSPRPFFQPLLDFSSDMTSVDSSQSDSTFKLDAILQ